MDDAFFKTREETQAWLDKMGVTGYTISDDLTVDVANSVYIDRKKLTRIPVQFGVVKGDFHCDDNQLTSLIGSPRDCHYLYCGFNQLTSLDGAPVKCSHFSCRYNQITSLVGGPTECQAILCSGNPITSLTGAAKDCMYIECGEAPVLFDISGAPDGCRLAYDPGVVAKNQAARQLIELESLSAGSAETSRPKSGRLL